MNRLVCTIAGGALLAAGAPLAAQNALNDFLPGKQPARTTNSEPVGAGARRVQMQPAGSGQPEGSSPAEIRQQENANAQQAQMAKAQLDQNAANEAEYRRRLAEVEAEKARIEQEALAAQQAYEAEKARREREYQQKMARWQADVDACTAGDFSRCDAPPPE